MHASRPRQLLLDFNLPSLATFDHFIVGDNAELLAHLHALSAPWDKRLLEQSKKEEAPIEQTTVPKIGSHPEQSSLTFHERTVYLWGDRGTGRSHLLQALSQHTAPQTVRFLTPKNSVANFNFDPEVVLYALDDCHQFSQEQQIAAFHLFNQFQAQQTHQPHLDGAFITTGDAPPAALCVRDDLRTRLAWGRVFQVLPICDTDKIAALKQAAQARGFDLAEEVCTYLLVHFRRDMPNLMGIFNALERFSREENRMITRPLLRTFLEQSKDHLPVSLDEES